jgi:CheY-like chemotaxis protein
MANVLIVDDDAALREGLAETVADLGHAPRVAASGREALAALGGNNIDCVLLDLRMPGGMDGIEVLRRIREGNDALPVIVLTAFATAENTIEAMRLGAFDHLTKPIGRLELDALLKRLPQRGIPLAADGAGESGTLIGSSEAMRRVQKAIGLAADRDATVLILGETGTGKELVARGLHQHGSRKTKPFVAVNCAAAADIEAAVKICETIRVRGTLVSSIAHMSEEVSDRSRWPVALSVLLVALVVVIAIAAALASTLLPPGDRIGEDGRRVAVGVIFVGSYLALAIGRIPGLSIDRAGIALVGAGLMVASGALPLEDAYKAVDLDTITLLLGMMIVVASLRLSGFFAVATAWVRAHAKRPVILLGAIVATSGVFSAFLVNDAICLVLAPLVLELTLALGRRPVPYLLAVAMASNVGSTATITGNPQNIMIGSFSHIPYTKFTLALGPVALVGLIITVALIALFHRAEFTGAPRLDAPQPEVDVNRVLVIRALLATLILIVLFFVGVVPAKAAIIIGGLLLLTRRVKSRRVYAEIDWSLLLMFAGLSSSSLARSARFSLLTSSRPSAGLTWTKFPCSAEPWRCCLTWSAMYPLCCLSSRLSLR